VSRELLQNGGREEIGVVSNGEEDVLARQRSDRELRRVKESFSYLLGSHIVRSVKQPWRIPLLVITVPKLLLEKIRKKTEKSPFVGVVERKKTGEVRNSIVFFPTNGVGLGHFTRLLAIARRVKKIDPQTEIVFFTTMPALQILENEGFASYHLSSKYVFEEMSSKTWNIMCEEMMSLVLDIHRPKAFVFDGSYPYRGMLDAIKGRNDLKKLWVLRGNFKARSKALPNDSFEHFDTMVFPADARNDSITTNEVNVDSLECGPIVMLEKEELVQREILLERLGLPINATIAYIQLGAGKINDIERDMRVILDALIKFDDLYVVVGESILGGKMEYKHPRIRVIREYPNSMYYQSFDFGILAGGYNSYHEAINFSLPAICLPNMETGRDDQLSRARTAEEAGCMIVVEKVNRESIEEALAIMMNPEEREKMIESSYDLVVRSGAIEVAEIISRD